MRDDRNDYDDNRYTPSNRSTDDGTGWYFGIIVALVLLAIAYLVFSANSADAASPATVTVTNIQPSKQHLGCSLAQAAENDGICISKELVLSD